MLLCIGASVFIMLCRPFRSYFIIFGLSIIAGYLLYFLSACMVYPDLILYLGHVSWLRLCLILLANDPRSGARMLPGTPLCEWGSYIGGRHGKYLSPWWHICKNVIISCMPACG